MIHPKTKLKFISNEMGYGVVATEFIPKGTITWVQDNFDQEFPQTEYENFGSTYREILDYYAFRNKHGNYILCWDNARFVNHSFNSNCLSTAYDFEFAVRDINAGEQLTDDYGYLNIEKPFRGIDEGTKRKVVQPDDLLKYYKIWDAKLQQAFRRISSLNQPLKQFIGDHLWEDLIKIEKGEKIMDSILNNHFKKN